MSSGSSLSACKSRVIRQTARSVPSESWVRTLIPPVQDDIRLAGTGRLKVKVIEERSNLTNGRDDALVDPCSVFFTETEQECRQVPRIGHQPAAVADVPILA